MRIDPRHYQIGVLTALLAYGAAGLGIDVRLPHAAVILVTALATQLLCTRIFRIETFDPRSPLISGLSLCLLLRTNDVWMTALAAVIAIAGKFLIRRRGKHVFNPTNLALVAMLTVTDTVWVSPGQWGTAAFLGFLLAGLGGLVVNRARRGDVTWAFLLFYSALVFGRALWLGDPLTIPLHELRNGAFLIFTFFMISDPKTTPNSRPGRILFAAVVAAGAGFVHYHLYQPNGLLWSLAASAPLVPFIDRLLPGGRYAWRSVRPRGGHPAGSTTLTVPALTRVPAQRRTQ